MNDPQFPTPAPATPAAQPAMPVAPPQDATQPAQAPYAAPIAAPPNPAGAVGPPPAVQAGAGQTSPADTPGGAINDAELYAGAAEEVDEATAVTDRIPPLPPGYYLARAEFANTNVKRDKNGKAFANIEIGLTFLEHPSIKEATNQRRSHYVNTIFMQSVRSTSADDTIKVLRGSKGHKLNAGQKRDLLRQLLQSGPVVGVKLDLQLTKQTGQTTAAGKAEYVDVYRSADQFPKDTAGNPNWEGAEAMHPGARARDQVVCLLPAAEVQQRWQTPAR